MAPARSIQIRNSLVALSLFIALAPAPARESKAAKSPVIPNIQISKSVLTLYSKTGEKEAEVRFDSQKAGGAEVSFVNPHASLLMKENTLELSAPGGTFDPNTHVLALAGGVSATRSDGTASFSTDRLTYNSTTRMIDGDGLLDLHWQGLHITGRVFHMDVTGKTFIMEKEVKVELAAQS